MTLNSKSRSSFYKSISLTLQLLTDTALISLPRLILHFAKPTESTQEVKRAEKEMEQRKHEDLLKVKHVKRRPCRQCSMVFPSSKQLSKHISIEHPQSAAEQSPVKTTAAAATTSRSTTAHPSHIHAASPAVARQENKVPPSVSTTRLSPMTLTPIPRSPRPPYLLS